MKIYAVMQTEDYEGDFIDSYYIEKSVARSVAKKLNSDKPYYLRKSNYMKFFVKEIEVIE